MEEHTKKKTLKERNKRTIRSRVNIAVCCETSLYFLFFFLFFSIGPLTSDKGKKKTWKRKKRKQKHRKIECEKEKKERNSSHPEFPSSLLVFVFAFIVGPPGCSPSTKPPFHTCPSNNCPKRQWVLDFYFFLLLSFLGLKNHRIFFSLPSSIDEINCVFLSFFPPSQSLLF